jgi:hypothetical protein
MTIQIPNRVGKTPTRRLERGINKIWNNLEQNVTLNSRRLYQIGKKEDEPGGSEGT